MSDPVVKIRFVRHKGIATNLISWREGTCMPFTPSHAECVTDEGTCIGEFGFGGMKENPAGYDLEGMDELPDGRKCELIVPLPVTQAQHDEFYALAREAVAAKEGYDWNAIFGFALTGHHHDVNTAFCSAKMFLLLRKIGYFKWPVITPGHEIDPRDLMLILSVCVEIPH
jgi:hypothetical protein